ncbi:MAG: superoxide dismutase [Planctomycetes bacterium]|nr:superoxide dismutase [Planctomycetota bacterium]
MKRFCCASFSVLGVMTLSGILLWGTSPSSVQAHCQVPCGIYDDAARIKRLHEDATTIAKAMAEMAKLAGGHDAQALNQGARWVATKEAHASHVIQVVSEYFLTQKVKPVAAGADGYDAYLAKLADHHAVMVAAMKTKQNAAASYAEKLHDAIAAMAKHYGS